MDVAKRSWQEIAKELGKEADPQKRQKLERDLGSALERAGFQKFSRRKQQPRDRQSQDK
jgi:hypothetical protein